MYRRKTSHLRGLYRALIATTRTLGYKYRLVGGDNGEHFGYPHQEKVILIGGDQSLTDKNIILAHELGHALDFSYNPMPMQELFSVITDFDTYKVGREYYAREKAAWKYAKDTLEKMGGYKALSPRFAQIRKRNLGAYYRQMVKARRGNTTVNQS